MSWQVKLIEPPSSIGINANPPPATLELILSLNLTYITGHTPGATHVVPQHRALVYDRTATSWTYLPVIRSICRSPTKALPYVHAPVTGSRVGGMGDGGQLPVVLRYSYSGQYPDDRYYDHQFYKGKARMEFFHTGILFFKLRSVRRSCRIF